MKKLLAPNGKPSNLIENLIEKGIVELKIYNTIPEHAKEYGLDSVNPLYVQSIYVSDNSRLKGIGKKVLAYIDKYAIKNGHDVIFGHITQKAKFTKDKRETFFSDIDMIKNWLHSNSYAINQNNNDFYKVVNTTFDANNPDIRYANGGIIEPNERTEYKGYKVGDIIEAEKLFELSGRNEGGIKGKKYILKQELLSNVVGDIQDIYDNVENNTEYMRDEDYRIREMMNNFNNTPPIPYTGDGLHRIVSAKKLGHKTILMWKEYNPDIRYAKGGNITFKYEIGGL